MPKKDKNTIQSHEGNNWVYEELALLWLYTWKAAEWCCVLSRENDYV